jgi:hypothetical protein
MLLVFIAAWSGPARGEDAGLAELAARVPPVAHVFVLDTSTEVLAAAEAARKDIAAVLDSLPAGDTVEILAMHARTVAALPAVTVTEESRVTLSNRVRTLALPSAEAADLGAGLAAVVEALGRPGAPTLAQVLILSTYCHHPVLGSTWDSGAAGCRTIKGESAIEASFQAMDESPTVAVHLFPVRQTNGSADPVGLDAATRLLRATPVTERPFSGWVAAYVLDLARERLRLAARRDIERLELSATVAEAATPEHPVVRVAFTAPTAVFGVRLVRLEVQGPVTAPVSAVVDLTASPTIEVPVRVPAPPFSLFPKEDDITLNLAFSAEAALVPADHVALLGVPSTRPGLSAELPVVVHRAYGLSATRAAVALLSVFLGGGAGAVWVRGRMMPRRLGGTFAWRMDGGPRQALDIAERAEVGIVVTPDGGLAAGPPGQAVLVLRMLRPLWTAHAEVEVRAPGVELNTRPLAPGRHRVVAGAASFQFGRYRLSWE